MIKLKTRREMEIMAESGRRLKKVVTSLLPKIKVGKTTNEIDKEAEKLIRDLGGEPSFQRVKNYNWSTCLPINEQIVHTPPAGRVLKEGDVLTLDIGFYHRGFHTDYATTFIVGRKQDEETLRFLEIGREALNKALKKVKAGRYLGEISQTIEENIVKNNFKVIPELTGHGIGRQLHEDPYVPGFLDAPVEKTYTMKPGLVIAVEVIYAKGGNKIKFEKGSDWSIVTADGSLSACFEHTIAIIDKRALILT